MTLQSPPSANVAPPGWYMLFLLNDGVPSVAQWVQLDGTAADVPAVPPDPPPPGPGPDPEPEPQPQPQDPAPGTEDPDAPDALPDFAAPALELAFPERRWLAPPAPERQAPRAR